MNEGSFNCLLRYVINMTKYPLNIHKNYHAHVYFEEQTLQFAKDLCHNAGKLFNLDVGKFHQKPIGPHPKWSCQLKFTSTDFEQFIPWLNSQREELIVLVHGVTGNNLQDHTDYAYWLGNEVPLNLAIFQQ